MSYYKPQRSAHEIVLYLSPRQSPPSVPFELQNQVTSTEWDSRLQSLIQASTRYTKPWFERIWLLLAIISAIVVPLGLQKLVYRAMISRDGNGFVISGSVVEANLALFASFAGILILFLVPIAVWKHIGARHLNALANKWTKSDRVNLGQNVASRWTVKSPRVWRDSTRLIITLPQNSAPSSFHPNAYLPSYINGPIDPDANYYYPYKSEPGLPRMSVVGNVPLYLDEKRAVVDHKV